jgi:hypothetical protein
MCCIPVDKFSGSFFAHQPANAIRQLGAASHPEGYSFVVNTDALLLTARDRVKKPNVFNKATVPRITGIGHCQVIKGAFL